MIQIVLADLEVNKNRNQPFKTKVRIERFKESGKYYDFIDTYSVFEVFESNKISWEMIAKYKLEMDFTLEVCSFNSPAWNKFLVKR